MLFLGIVGYGGSGKTTLLTAVIPLLTSRGLAVATIKHTHHAIEPLPPHHASEAWRTAGAREIMLAAPGRHLLVHELHGEAEPAIGDLARLLSPVDLLLIEGYKFGPHRKLEVFRRECAAPLLAASDPRVIALATNCGRPPGLPEARALPIFSLEAPSEIAGFIASLCEPGEKRSMGRAPP